MHVPFARSWTYPPFEMTYVEAEHIIYGRGVDDDKGCLLQALHVSGCV